MQLKLTDNIEQGLHSPNVALTVPGKAGQLTWLLSGSVFENRQHNESDARQLDETDAGQVVREQFRLEQNDGRSRGKLRLAANNLIGDDYLNARTIRANGLAQSAFCSARTYTTWSLKLEMKL